MNKNLSMIADTFNFLSTVLDKYLKETVGTGTINIGLLDEMGSTESVNFPKNQITPILINVERENQLRSPDLFARITPDQKRLPVMPDIRVNLFILFVARFDKYETALTSLGLILEFFQSHPVFDHENSDELRQIDEKNRMSRRSNLNQLAVELISLPISEQNEVWNSLRSAYQPSLLYRVKLLSFMTEPDKTEEAVKEIKINTEHWHDSL